MEVLRAALQLLRATEGPVLSDFGREAPISPDGEHAAWACLLPLPPQVTSSDAGEALRARFQDEIRLLRPWYDEGRRRTGRTSVGLSGLGPEAIENMGDVMATVATGGEPLAPQGATPPMPMLLRYIADDLKAYYFEAATAQPGARRPTAPELNRWLFRETAFGDILYAARDAVLARPEPAQQLPGRFFVPAAFARRA